jgi:arylsulfatase A
MMPLRRQQVVVESEARARRSLLFGLLPASLTALLGLHCQGEPDLAFEDRGREEDGGPPGRPGFWPNLVLIYLDDAGYADTGPTGADFPTPHLDELARQGTVYTSFHVAQAVCSPSRAALLTGTYPNRIGITRALFPDDSIGIGREELTLAEIARSAGYRTAALGKWHLGSGEPFSPLNHGFDEFAGIPYSNDMWPEESEEFPPLAFWEGANVQNPAMSEGDQRDLTPKLTDYAVKFIERNKERPFLLYLAHPKPHVPLFVSSQFEGASGHGLYADVMMEIDWSVGQILEALDNANLAHVTWVIFASDNGPWLSYGNHAGSARPYREGKFTSFEGGTRVPLLMRFPGHVPPGEVNAEPFMNIDILPTFARLIGAELPNHVIDGKDVWGTIREGVPSPHDAYFFWNSDTLEGVLRGRFKLHLPHDYQTVSTPGFDGGRGVTDVARLPLSLFDLESDPSEIINMAAEHPELVSEMRALGEAHEAELRANQRAPGRL